MLLLNLTLLCLFLSLSSEEKLRIGSYNGRKCTVNTAPYFEKIDISTRAKLNGNVITTNEPITIGKKYKVSEDELSYLTHVAKKEQDSLEGVKMEVSLMANLYDKINKVKYPTIVDYVVNGKWFAKRSLEGYNKKKKPSQKYIDATREVLFEGKRYVGLDVNEHDCIKDLIWVSTTNKKYNRAAYIPGETILYNNNCAKYIFVGFAPGKGGDPFGVKVSEPPVDISTTCNIVDKNTISASKPFTSGKKHKVSDDELARLAYIASKEQDSLEGIKLEVSLMANLYDKISKSKYATLLDYVVNGTKKSLDDFKEPSQEYIKAAREVLVEGKRYFDSKVNMHASINDITSVSSTKDNSDRKAYIPGVSILHNSNGEKFIFVGFAPGNGGKLYGVKKNTPQKTTQKTTQKTGRTKTKTKSTKRR